ncbi:MAG: hypothetical protein M0C28_29200 [Candidatus Moduliflexus flocculans]|nr:hypothetical protein [Candidatus Moduliflexus flocculans]
MKTSTRILLGLALGLLGAVLYILAFQPYSVWPLAFVVFVPMLIAEQRILPLRWSGLGRGTGHRFVPDRIPALAVRWGTDDVDLLCHTGGNCIDQRFYHAQRACLFTNGRDLAGSFCRALWMPQASRWSAVSSR